MKTLSKLATKKSGLPILNTVLVQNNIAIATDIDMEIRHETHLKDGLYCGINFDKIQIPFTGKEKNFPLMRDFEGEVTSLEISLESLEFVAQGMSKEETRYYPCGICFDKNCIITTDGHRRYKQDLPEYGLQKQILMPSIAVNYIISIMKECKKKSGNLTIHQVGEFDGFTFTCGNYILKSKPIGGKFPDYTRVIPKDAPCVGYWNTTALKPIFAEISLIAKSLDYKRPNVAFEDNQVKIKYDKYEKSWDIEGLNFPQKTGFNLFYAKAVPSGSVYMKSAGDPMRVDCPCGTKQAVLMPLRLKE